MSQSRNVGPYYGPFLLGGLIAFGLSGCVNIQFIVYWQTYSKDPWPTKSLVVTTWLLDVLHCALIIASLWDMIITHFGDWGYIDTISWSLGPSVAVTAMVTFLVQSFFAYRLYKLQRKKLIVAGPLVICSFCRLVAACVAAAEMVKLKQFSALSRPYPSWIVTLGMGLSAFVDIVITIFICYFLRSNRSGIQSTNRIIDTLTLWTIQNGSVTSLAATASLICWLAMPLNGVSLGIHFVITKLYANSLLAILNTRTMFRDPWRYNTDNPIPPPIHALSGHVFGTGDEAGQARSQPYSVSLDGYLPQPTKHHGSIAVKVDQTVESTCDDAPDVGFGRDDIKQFFSGSKK